MFLLGIIMVKSIWSYLSSLQVWNILNSGNFLHPKDWRKLGVLHAIPFLSAKKPECTTDPECPDHLACIREKCQNPCFTTTCGVNAECSVIRHRAICSCKPGFEGDPYRICEERKLYLV